ncbi:MAG: TIM barrel protein [Acidobacteria bacterium]|nr:TIM barrel protein [Acidobacteriota bacterium]
MTNTWPSGGALRIGNAPCSWGALEFGGDQAYSYAQVLDEMAASGFAGTELGDWGFMPTEPKALRDALAERGLALVGAFVPVALAAVEAHASGRAAALRVARLLTAVTGATTPVVVLADANGTVPERTTQAGRITPGDSLSEAQWDVFSRGTSEIARAVRDETGLRTVFHPHCAGYVEAGWELDALLKRTDPAVVGLCLDTGHLTFGGGDPVECVRQYASRIWHVHFKDCDPHVAETARSEGWDYFTAVGHGVFCELGRGEVDFPAVLAALRTSSYAGWVVVEQDVLPGLGTPAESATRNRAYLREVGV